MEYKQRMKELGIQEALEYMESVINTMHDPLIILYEDLKVALASRSFYQTFEVKSGETEGRFIYDLGNRQWNIPKLRQLLEDILPKMGNLDNFEVEHDFPSIGKRVMLLNACRIYMEGNRMKLIIITIKDITEHKMINELRNKIDELEERLKKCLEKSHPPHLDTLHIP